MAFSHCGHNRGDEDTMMAHPGRGGGAVVLTHTDKGGERAGALVEHSQVRLRQAIPAAVQLFPGDHSSAACPRALPLTLHLRWLRAGPAGCACHQTAPLASLVPPRGAGGKRNRPARDAMAQLRTGRKSRCAASTNSCQASPSRWCATVILACGQWLMDHGRKVLALGVAACAAVLYGALN